MQQKQSLHLSIPTPCHENWGNMSPNERGRHCNTCNKTVIDFSLLTDKQLLEFFSKVTGSVCGRLTSYQTNRQLVYIEQPVRNHFLYKLLFGTALTFGVAGSANANYNPDQKPLVEHYTGNTAKENEKMAKDSDKHILVTVIDDSTKQGIPFAGIVFMKDGKQIGTWQTDVDGKTEIPPFTSGTYDIIVYYTDYKDYMQPITLDKSTTRIEIRMKSKYNMQANPVIMVAGNIIPRMSVDSTKKKK